MFDFLKLAVFSLCIMGNNFAVGGTIREQEPLQDEPCEMDLSLLAEIRSYQNVANQIIDAAMNGPFKGRTFDELAAFVDKHVNRLTGTPELEASIDDLMGRMSAEGLVNVRSEPVTVPRWIRGEEKAMLIEPTVKKIEVIGLGPSVGTPPAGIYAEVIVVKSFDDLDEKKDLVNGKIVVYNQGWLGTYGAAGIYRGTGAVRASQYGAVAALMESITPFSLNTVHTGNTYYDVNVTKIPFGCISQEDAEMLYRIYNRGETIVMNLTMLDEELQPVISRNALGEILGTTLPNEIVQVSGHIDAWDVGQGVMDDAGGVILSTEALFLLKSLGLAPKRTLQVIAWTAEEQGVLGAIEFVKQHESDLINYNVAFEADLGVFRPTGLDFTGSHDAGCIVQEVLKLLQPINATMLTKYPLVGSDISLFIPYGVPVLSLATDNDKYFWYHHSPSDMMTAANSTEMDMNVALWATVSYVLADLSISLPREIPQSPIVNKS